MERRFNQLRGPGGQIPKIVKTLERLETRLNKIEYRVKSRPAPQEPEPQPAPPPSPPPQQQPDSPAPVAELVACFHCGARGRHSCIASEPSDSMRRAAAEARARGVAFVSFSVIF